MRDEFSRIQFVSRVVKKGVSQGGTNSSKSVMRLGLGTPNMNISNPLSLFFYRGHPTYVEEKILIIFTLKWYVVSDALLLEPRPGVVLQSLEF